MRFRLCQRQSQQSPEIEFVAGGQSQRSEDANIRHESPTLRVGVCILRAVDEITDQRTARFQWTERVFDQ